MSTKARIEQTRELYRAMARSSGWLSTLDQLRERIYRSLYILPQYLLPHRSAQQGPDKQERTHTMSTIETNSILSALSEAINDHARIPGLLAEIERLTKVIDDQADTIELQKLEIDAIADKHTTLRQVHDETIAIVNAQRNQIALLEENNRVLTENNRGLADQLYEANRVNSNHLATIALRDSEIASLNIALDDSRSLAARFKASLDRIFGEVSPVVSPAPEVAPVPTFPGSAENPLSDDSAGNSLPPVAPTESVSPVVGEAHTEESPTDFDEFGERNPNNAKDEDDDIVRDLTLRFGYWV